MEFSFELTAISSFGLLLSGLRGPIFFPAPNLGVFPVGEILKKDSRDMIIYQFVLEQLKHFLVDCRDLVLKGFHAEVSKSLLVRNVLEIARFLSVALKDENSPMRKLVLFEVQFEIIQKSELGGLQK